MYPCLCPAECFHRSVVDVTTNCKRYYAGGMPTKRVMLKQIWASMKALPLFISLPAVAEHVIEKGWTRAFVRIEEVGWPIDFTGHIDSSMRDKTSLQVFSCYPSWIQQGRNDFPFCRYKQKSSSSSSHACFMLLRCLNFTVYAFDPIDGIVRAAPQALALFMMHLVTHELLFVCKGMLAANAHDGIHGKVWPVMGGGYHKIHRTKSRYTTTVGLPTSWTGCLALCTTRSRKIRKWFRWTDIYIS